MKNKFYTIMDMFQIAGNLYLLGYFINTLRRSHALHLRIERATFVSVNEMRHYLAEAIYEISPKCKIMFDNSEFDDDGTVGIRVDNMTKKERIQLESVIPYWHSVHIG